VSNTAEPKRVDAPITSETAGAALASVPTAPTERGGALLVASSKATEAEVDDIEKAIDHPPTKPDLWATVVSVAGSAGVIARTITAPIDHGGPKDLAVLVVFSALGGSQFVRYLMALFSKTPLQDLAKRHIDRLKRAQGWKPEGEPVTNWQRLRKALWDRAFAFVEHKKS